MSTSVAVNKVGATGTSGFSGYSGAAGASGFSGYSGVGTSGFSGYSGAQGTSGFSGYSGAQGTSGFSGYSGAQGTSGFSGYSGIDGTGTSGFSGYSGVGTSGFSGYSGVGTSGFSGYSGAAGTSGFSGYSGNSTSGFSGYSGTTGSSGFSGYSGAAGAATPLSIWAPYDYITSGSAVSSHAPASIYFNRIQPNEDLAFNKIWVWKSMNASVPGATSQASTGTLRYTYTQGLSIFRRSDFAVSSGSLSFVTSGSFGLTAGLSYSSTSQSFVMSWVTDSTGGTTSTNTTSNAGNWSSWVTGNKAWFVPFGATTLAAGQDYYIAHQHSSTTGTTQSNATMLSFSNVYMAPQTVSFGILGTTGSQTSLGFWGMGQGVATGVTTNAAMDATKISASVVNLYPVRFQNF